MAARDLACADRFQADEFLSRPEPQHCEACGPDSRSGAIRRSLVYFQFSMIRLLRIEYTGALYHLISQLRPPLKDMFGLFGHIPCVAPSSSAWQGGVGEDCSSPMAEYVVCVLPGRVPQPPCQDRQRRVTSSKRRRDTWAAFFCVLFLAAQEKDVAAGPPPAPKVKL